MQKLVSEIKNAANVLKEKSIEELDTENIFDLRGIKTAIKEGDLTLETAFSLPPKINTGISKAVNSLSKNIEFGDAEYKIINDYCAELDMVWFASCWDEEAVDFLEKFNPMLYKAASASLTDISLLKKKMDTGRPLMISTGMSTIEELKTAVAAIGTKNLAIAHATSTYPCKPEELNLRMINTLQEMYPTCPIGYSGHETGLSTTLATIPMGANFIERHFTLDRSMWGSDQSASVEPGGMTRLVKDIRDIETALGDGVKKVYESEMGPRAKLRRVI
jgi:N-acetylneuraminate synthase